MDLSIVPSPPMIIAIRVLDRFAVFDIKSPAELIQEVECIFNLSIISKANSLLEISLALYMIDIIFLSGTVNSIHMVIY